MKNITSLFASEHRQLSTRNVQNQGLIPKFVFYEEPKNLENKISWTIVDETIQYLQILILGIN